MLTYDLGDKNKYYALYKSIRQDILCGKLKFGERLPAKRSLAQNLNVSVVTVQTAYEQLLAEGYITSRERSGYFVADVPAEFFGGAVLTEEEPAREKQYRLDLVKGVTPAEAFPFSVWAKLMRKVLSEQGEHLLERVPCDGDAQLKREIASLIYRTRGVSVEPRFIIIGAGAEYLYGVIVHLLGTEKPYAVETPGYGKIRSAYNLYGADCVYIPVGENGADCAAVEKSGARAVHLSPSHQYPTGAVMPAANRVRLIKWAQESGAYIVEDDYDSEFRLSGKPLQAMLALNRDRVIYVNTFSKTLAPSMRMGYAVLPPALYEKYLALYKNFASVVPLFEQKALAAMIGEGHLERHISRLKNHYRQIRGKLVEKIESLPYEKVISDTGSGLHLTVEFPSAQSDLQIKEEAARRGINIKCLSDYSLAAGSAREKTAVINYSGLTLEKLNLL